MSTCLICGEGSLQSKKELISIVRNQCQFDVISRYSVCDHCHAEQADHRDMHYNTMHTEGMYVVKCGNHNDLVKWMATYLDHWSIAKTLKLRLTDGGNGTVRVAWCYGDSPVGITYHEWFDARHLDNNHESYELRYMA